MMTHASARDERNAIVLRECGVCGKSMKAPNTKGGWLCPEHVEKTKRKKNNVRYMSMCNSCAHLPRCENRINSALWVLCELPGIGDIDRVRAMLRDQSITVHQAVDFARENY
jgi:hypothetical protein